MSGSLRLISGILFCLMAACVTTTMDGGKPLKDEDPEDAAAKYNIQLGTAYLQQGNYALAREKLERSLKQNPKDPDVHTSLGLLYDRTGDAKLADKHFKEALRLAPDKPDISNNYAIYLCKNGRADEGVDRFMAVAANKYYRTPEVALTNAGVCLRSVKRLDEAAQKFNGAIKARPNYSEATVQLASLHLERNELAEARKVVDTYLNAFKPQPDVLLSAVTVARASKDRMSEEKYSARPAPGFSGLGAGARTQEKLSVVDDSSAPAAAPAPRSIGQRLRAGRERAGLSMAAAAEKLHLDIKVIEALEADRFAELGASVYVRGHLRRYADFVGEPGVELVNIYAARSEARPPPPDLTQIPQAERRADPRRLVTPLVGLGCALVLALAIWWVLAGSQSSTPASSGPATSNEVSSCGCRARDIHGHAARAAGRCRKYRFAGQSRAADHREHAPRRNRPPPRHAKRRHRRAPRDCGSS